MFPSRLGFKRIDHVLAARLPAIGMRPSRKIPHIVVQFLYGPANAMELLDETQNDIDALVLDAKIAFQIPD
jgi:hypothetical protein